MQHASADVGLIFTAFNLRRIFNLLDKNELKKYLKVLDFLFLILKSQFKAIRSTIFSKKWLNNLQEKTKFKRLNRLYLNQNWFGFELIRSF